MQPSARPAVRRGRLAAVLFAVVSILLTAAVPVLWPAHRFPRPGGPYGIGTVTHHWVDPVRTDPLATDRSAPRELVAQIWYPARTEPSAPRAPYLADADAVIRASAGLHGYPRLALAGLGTATTNAVAAAPPVDDPGRFPVLLFLEGITGYRQMNTFQIEELVSHGYAVVALDQPGVAADVVLPGGRHSAAVPPAVLQELDRPAFGPVAAAPTWRGRAFPHGVLPFLAEDVTLALDRLAAIDASDPAGLLTPCAGRAGPEPTSTSTSGRCAVPSPRPAPTATSCASPGPSTSTSPTSPRSCRSPRRWGSPGRSAPGARTSWSTPARWRSSTATCGAHPRRCSTRRPASVPTC
jgi:hypothetical protein